MLTFEQLKQLESQLQSMNTDISEMLLGLVRSEIKRRRGAGRRSSGVDRKEQNRLSQQRFRAKRKKLQDNHK